MLQPHAIPGYRTELSDSWSASHEVVGANEYSPCLSSGKKSKLKPN